MVDFERMDIRLLLGDRDRREILIYITWVAHIGWCIVCCGRDKRGVNSDTLVHQLTNPDEVVLVVVLHACDMEL